MEHGTHPDLTWVVPSGAHEMRREDVDQPVIGAAGHTPFEAAYRVFVIERADTMGDPVANALLKTLEEPPAYVVLLLLTDRPSQVLPTIASRCQPVRFDAPSPAEGSRRRMASRGAAPPQAEAAARLSLGDGERALALATGDGAALRAHAEAFARAPLHGKPGAAGPLLEVARTRGAAARAAYEARLAEELAYLPKKEHKRRETELGGGGPARRAPRAHRRARPRPAARRPLVSRPALRRRRRARPGPPRRPRGGARRRCRGPLPGRPARGCLARRRLPRPAEGQRHGGAGLRGARPQAAGRARRARSAKHLTSAHGPHACLAGDPQHPGRSSPVPSRRDLMGTPVPSPLLPPPIPDTDAGLALDAARAAYWEDPAGALAVAIDVHEQARALGDAPLRGRALALQAMISMHRGDLRGAFALAAEAEGAVGEDVRACAELAGLMAHLDFFSGSYASSLRHAERATELADSTGDLHLRLFARRMGCIAFGNLGVADWPRRLDETLALARRAGARWEEALSRNDLAHLRMEQGDLAGAEAELAHGIALADGLAPANGSRWGSCTARVRRSAPARAGRRTRSPTPTSRSATSPRAATRTRTSSA